MKPMCCAMKLSPLPQKVVRRGTLRAFCRSGVGRWLTPFPRMKMRFRSMRVPSEIKFRWWACSRSRPRCGCNCHCGTIVEKAPERADLRTILSGLKLKVQDYAGGESEARQAIDLDTCIPEAHLNLALILYQTSRMEEALAACNAAIAADESFVSAYFTAGTVQLALGQHVAAMNAYNKVLELEPAHAEALLILATYIESTSILRLQVPITNGRLPQRRAMRRRTPILHRKDQGRMEAALSAFKKAVELDPTMHRPAQTFCFVFASRRMHVLMTFSPNIKCLMNCMLAVAAGSVGTFECAGSKSAAAYRFAIARLPIHPGGHFSSDRGRAQQGGFRSLLLLQLHCPRRLDGTLRAFFRSLPSCRSLER